MSTRRPARSPRQEIPSAWPYHEHLRRRRTEESGVPVKHLFEEIRALGYTRSLNLLHKYLNQGRHESDRIMPSPRRLTSWITTRPGNRPTSGMSIW
ncbi:hypothetical protein [Streptomyces sp. NBC_00842]|uniref:hypothetical protein n=1 Tax=unclassified Streptomyces TaxID=2593676 RepID=UPI0038681417